jgi:SAM-dependent methyltransferase
MVENVFVTNPNRKHVAGYFFLGEMPWTIIKYLIEKYKPVTVLDVGCGPMASVRLFHQYGIRDVWAIDGDPQLLDREDLMKDGLLKTFSVVDLERSVYRFPMRFDLVFSFEVAEHIGNVDNYIDTITENCENILAMTHALQGQGGYGHVNEQPDQYWISRIEKKGFKCLEKESMEARKLGDSYFSLSGLIFQRIK